MLNIKVWSLTLGLFGAVSFVLCVAYGAFVPPTWHGVAFLEMLPGFKWLTVGAFCLGLIDSFVLGAYVGVVLIPIHNFFFRRWGISR